MLGAMSIGPPEDRIRSTPASRIPRACPPSPHEARTGRQIDRRVHRPLPRDRLLPSRCIPPPAAGPRRGLDAPAQRGVRPPG